jgi:Protein of unknown function (DUF2971)
MNEVSKAVLPPILYKYCPPERIDITSSFQIHFSPPADFNDTFDTWCFPPSSETRPGSEAARAKLASARRRSQFGILCLTQRADNHLMWVNYAQNHTGFVIGFRTSSPFFQAGGTGLRKVIYDFPPRGASDEDTCFYKAKDWKYEEEWRYVRTFGHSESRLADIDENLIAEIIFGHSMEQGDISELVSNADALLKTSRSASLAFFQSTPDPSKRKFVKKPKTVECCSRCHGSGYHMENKAPE